MQSHAEPPGFLPLECQHAFDLNCGDGRATDVLHAPALHEPPRLLIRVSTSALVSTSPLLASMPVWSLHVRPMPLQWSVQVAPAVAIDHSATAICVLARMSSQQRRGPQKRE